MATEHNIQQIKTGIIRIYNSKTRSVVGAGFLVSATCLLTCVHVVTEALGIPIDTTEMPEEEIELDFPFLLGETKRLKAHVVFWSPVKPGRRGEDIAGLKIADHPPMEVCPLNLKKGDRWWGHSFGIFGFPKNHDSGIWADGELREQRGDDGWVQMEGMKAQGVPVQPGFSGAPIWDRQTQAVVGMAVAAERKREDAKVSFMIPTEILAPALDTLSLAEILMTGNADLERRVQVAYRAARPTRWLSPEPSTIAKILADLREMPPGNYQVDRTLLFVGQLILDSNLSVTPTMRQQLQKWAVSKTDNFQQILEQIQLSSHAVGNSYLLVSVRSKQQKGASSSQAVKYYFVNAWFVPDHKDCVSSETATCEPLQVELPPERDAFLLEEIPGLIENLLIQIEEFQKLTIEFFLPIELMNEPVEFWKLELYGLPEAFSENYQVVVRSVERLQPSYNLLKGLWRQKWKQLQNVAGQSFLDLCFCGDECTPEKIKNALKKEKWIGLNLAQCPELVEKGSVFAAVLQSGIPVAVWLRLNSLNLNCPSLLNQVLSCQVLNLPERVKAERDSALDFDRDAHIGHHLSLLWENPYRIPTTFPLSMPN